MPSAPASPPRMPSFLGAAVTGAVSVAGTGASLLGTGASLLGAGASLLATGARAALGTAQGLMEPGRDVSWTSGRCYIAVSGVHGAGGEAVRERVQRALEQHPGVLWARVNAPMERVIVAVASPAPPQSELVALVEGAEGDHAADAQAFDDWQPEPHHPAEGAPYPAVPALVADTLGLALVTLRRLAPWFGLPPEVAGGIDALSRHPRLRHLVKETGDGDHNDSMLPVIGALAQGVATGGGGLTLDVLQRLAVWREASAEGSAWRKGEARLVRGPEEAAAEAVVAERSGPTPQDAADRYAERSMAAGIAAGLVALPFAGLRKAIAVAVASVPKAPDAGREGYATTLGRHLALRGVVTMDRTALRRLGQVDTIVLEEAALRSNRFELIDLELLGNPKSKAATETETDPKATPEPNAEPETGAETGAEPGANDGAEEGTEPGAKGGADDKGPKAEPEPKPGTERPKAETEQVSHQLFALFDPDAPLAVRRDGDWILGPLEDLDLKGRTGRKAEKRLRRRGSEKCLGLARKRRLVAVAGLGTPSAPGAEAVAAAARRAGARVVVASDRKHPGLAFADAVVPAGDQLAAAVRHLQAEGAVVLLVSGDRAALAAADCAIGVHREDEHTPWGAHVLVGADLEAAGLIVDAAGTAAVVDRDSHHLAAGGSGIGSVAALQGPAWRATARVLAIGNTSAAMAFALGAWRARQLLSRPLTPPVTSVPWHLMPTDRVMVRLDTRPEGLTPQEVAARGAGALTGEPAKLTLPYAFVEELSNPLTPILAAGAALSAAVGSRTDAALVAAITAVSALVGGFQRVRTDKALAQLFAQSAIGARVRREGRERLVTSADLVPGDVIHLRPEDVVPADCRLLEAEGLEVDESSLTGESLAVSKDPAPVVTPHLTERRSMLYEGTTVSAGRGTAVVVATGSATEAGRSLATARQAAPETGVEARLSSLTRASMPIALGSAVAVTLSGLLHGRPLTENLSSAVNLAVASVPEGLPFLVNAAQLAAARRLADAGALVRNPRTIEALGRADILCFDKTGTLTEGTLTLSGVSDGNSPADPTRLDGLHKDILAAGLRATPPARQAEPMAHQTDRAIVDGARRANVTTRQGAARWRRTDALPFEPARAYHATTGHTSGGILLSVKGAPENVIDRCARRRRPQGASQLDDADRSALARAAEELAAAGRRVLAVAERRMEPDEELSDDSVRDLVFLGFLTLADPVRDSAAPATARLREAGVHTVMLTGDHPATADAIASTIIDVDEPKVCTGPEIDELDDDALDALLPGVDVIARCSPTHKVRIVQAYQRIGRVVAMTGDGANDAPAIRLADVGIALGRRGTPAATAAADLVVTDDRLETIVAALMEGRAMWTSVRAALAILIGGNFGEVAFSVLISTVTGSTPLNARQIMLVNLLTDLAPSLAIAVRQPSEQTGERLLAEGPHRSLGTSLTREMVLRGVVTALGAGLAWTGARVTGRGRRASTVSLAALVGTQLAQTLTTGGTDRHVLVAGLGSAAVLMAIIQTPGASQFFGCTPLGPVAWTITLASITAATLLGHFLGPRLTTRLIPPQTENTPPADAGEQARKKSQTKAQTESQTGSQTKAQAESQTEAVAPEH
ncbi:HAD-IC family P-type ATPase [Streptomyces sp. NPDC127092]|uniref:HAD-IC family P-type ATPase n=1 Tax=Streptomyces sp. NPDC127092 TaxID=3347135 RepID=UPI00364CD629